MIMIINITNTNNVRVIVIITFYKTKSWFGYKEWTICYKKILRIKMKYVSYP